MSQSYEKTYLKTRFRDLPMPLGNKAYYQAFFWVLIDLIVELLGLIIKPFDNQTESWNPVSNDLIIKSFDTIIW